MTYERHPAAQAIEPSTSGAFTGRISAIASQTEATNYRLRAVLNHLRIAPPSPVEKNETSGRQTCIEDFLQRTESANEVINHLLNELEGLFQ